MAKKKRSSSFLTVLLVMLLLIIMTLTMLLGLYRLNKYPVLNTFIDAFISRFIDSRKEPVEQTDIPRTLSPILIESGSALQKTAHFLGELQTVNGSISLLKSFEHEMTESGLTIKVSPDFKTLSVSGMLQRFDPLYDGIDESVSSWTLHTQYPIISRPCLFQDCIVFIDASPSLFAVNILNGASSSGQYVPFFPDTQAASMSSVVQVETEQGITTLAAPHYVVLGRNGKVYGFAFTDGQIPVKAISPPSINASIFMSQKEIAENMEVVIMNWAGISEPPAVMHSLVMNDDYSPLPVDLQAFSFITFMLPSAGNYIAGLSDESGVFIRDKAVVCIFTQEGDLVGVSVDYESDRPNVTSHFNENTIYYALCTAYPGSGLGTSYFSIKKALK